MCLYIRDTLRCACIFVLAAQAKIAWTCLRRNQRIATLLRKTHQRQRFPMVLQLLLFETMSRLNRVIMSTPERDTENMSVGVSEK